MGMEIVNLPDGGTRRVWVDTTIPGSRESMLSRMPEGSSYAEVTQATAPSLVSLPKEAEEEGIMGQAGDAISEAAGAVGDALTGDANWLETGVDVAKGLGMGVLKSGAELGRSIADVTPDLGVWDAIEDAVPVSRITFDEKDPDDILFSLLTEEENDKRMYRWGEEFDAAGASTPAGKFAESITQFLAGFAVFGKVGLAVKGVAAGAKLITGTEKVGMAAKLAGATVKSGMAEGFGFAANTATISSMIQDTSYANEINAWLVADEDAGLAEKRMLRAIEGAALGGVVDVAIVGILRAYKAGLKKLDEAGDGILDPKIIQKIDKEFQSDMSDVAADSSKLIEGDAVPPVSSLVDDAVPPVSSLDLDGVPPVSSVQRSVDDIYPYANRHDLETVNAAAKRLDELKTQPMVDVESFTERMGLALKAGAMHDPLDKTPVLNWSRMSADADGSELSRTWNALTDTIAGTKGATQGRATAEGVVTHNEVTLKAADIIERSSGMDAGTVIREFEMRGLQAEDIAAQLQAGAHMQLDMSKEIIALARRAEKGDVVAQNLMPERIRQMESMSRSIKDMSRGAARATAAGRIMKDIQSRTLQPSSLKAADGSDLPMIKGPDGSDMIDPAALARRIITLDEGDGLVGIVRQIEGESTWSRGVRGTNEFYINSLLSNPSTQFVNVIGSTSKTFMQPVEKIMGGLMGGDGAAAAEGGRQFMHLFSSLRESLAFGVKTFKTYDGILDPGKGTQEYLTANAISMERKDWMKSGPSKAANYTTAAAVNFIGTVVRMPSRLLLTVDEVLKQINYRASLRSQIETKASTMFRMSDDGIAIPKEDGDVLRSEYVEREFKNGFDAKGKGINTVARDDARAGTFTTPLDPNRGAGTAMVGAVNGVISRVPLMRQFAPFVRTPWNILTDVAQRTPGLNLMNRNYVKELRSTDPMVAAKAKGKMAMGTVLWSGAAMLATEGKITGAGPKDYKLRAGMVALGWRPYSFVTESSDGILTYTPFNRLDPIATFLGMAADWNEIASNLDAEENEQIMVMLFDSTMDQLTSKTFIKSTMNVINALTSSRPGSFEKGIAAHISGFAPGILQTSSRVYDDWTGVDKDGRPSDVKRLTKGGAIFDKFLGKIPGYSDSLPAQYNIITGEPIMVDQTPGGLVASSNFMPQAVLRSDPVSVALMAEEIPFYELDRSDDDYEFNDQEISALYELTFRSNPNGRSLYAEIERLMRTGAYKRAHSGIDLSGEIRNTRRDMIMDQINKNVRKGREALAKQSPRYAAYLSESDNVKRLVNSKNTAKQEAGQSRRSALLKLLREG